MFSERLKQLREKKELSQAELAKILNVTQQTINNYENGKRQPSTEMLQRIADFFNVSADCLLGRSSCNADLTGRVDFMSLGGRIAGLRENTRLTQEELADKIGITRAALSHYEKDRREPDYETLKKIADFFNVTTDYLLGHSPYRRINTNELGIKELELYEGYSEDNLSDERILQIIKELIRARDKLLSEDK